MVYEIKDSMWLCVCVFNKVRMHRFLCLSVFAWIRLCAWENTIYMWVKACVRALLSMPACHSDLPITRSIKSLIPKIHASNSMILKKKIAPKEKKWLNLLFAVACSLSYTPVQPATEHEHENVFYLYNHRGRGLTGTLNPEKATTFTLPWLHKKKKRIHCDSDTAEIEMLYDRNLLYGLRFMENGLSQFWYWWIIWLLLKIRFKNQTKKNSWVTNRN